MLQVARFAVEVVAVAKSTLVDMEDPTRGCIHLRVGFHSGPVVSAVIGNKHPKWTLYGAAASARAAISEQGRSGNLVPQAIR